MNPKNVIGQSRDICMIAYANYFTDARIKNYVDALIGRGYVVDVFALGQPIPTPPGLRVFCLMRKTWSKSALAYLLSQFWFMLVCGLRVSIAHRRCRYALIHVHNMPDLLVFSALIPRLLGARIILDVHDTMPEAYATKFDLPLSHPLIGMIRVEERLSVAFADHVITTNDLHKEALVEHGIPGDKIDIVMNVGNEKIFYPRPRPDNGHRLILAYHGTIAERLGPDLILQAIHRILPACPDLHFLLIGDGDFKPAVMDLIARYDLEDVVTVKGWMPVEDLPDHLAKAHVGVVGNRSYTESRQNWMLPVKMLEYASMNIPTIAPRLRIIEHYFDDRSAIFYKPDDAEDLARHIQEVYEQPTRLQSVKAGLSEFNERWNWSRMAKEYLRLVETKTEAQTT